MDNNRTHVTWILILWMVGVMNVRVKLTMMMNVFLSKLDQKCCNMCSPEPGCAGALVSG